MTWNKKSVLYLISVTLFMVLIFNSVLVNCDNPASEQTLFNIWILLSFVSHNRSARIHEDCILWSVTHINVLMIHVSVRSSFWAPHVHATESIHLYLPRTCGFTPLTESCPLKEQGVFVWIDTRPPLVMLLQGLLEEAPIDSTGPRFSAQNRPEVHANSFTIQIHLCNSFLYINVSYVFWDLISLRNNSEFCFYIQMN